MQNWEFIIIILLLFLAVYLFLPVQHQQKRSSIESFDPLLDYSRTHPGTFAYNNSAAYLPLYRSWPNNLSFPTLYDQWPGNLRYNPGYSDYWYIPAHEYLKNWMGRGSDVPNWSESDYYNYYYPLTTSTECVQNEIQQTGNLDLSVYRCLRKFPRDLSVDAS